MITIQGKNNYQLENTDAGTWKINIIRGKEYFNSKIKKALEDFKEDIFFNDLTCENYFMDYKINDIWVECININNNMTIDIGLFKLS